jgi:hypothetical protein
MSELDFVPRPVDISDIDRIVEIEQQGFRRFGFDELKIEEITPDPNNLEFEINTHPDNYLGTYVASRLVGFTVLGDWSADDEIPFAHNMVERGLLHLSDTLASKHKQYPIGIFRIGVDQDESEVNRYRIAHGILRTVSLIADSESKAIHMPVYNPPNNPIVAPLLHWDFKDVGRHIGSADHSIYTAKYMRTPKRKQKGKTVGRFAHHISDLVPKLT